MAKQTTDGIDPDDPDALDAMADRLEAALDRIVRHLDTSRPIEASPPQGSAAGGKPPGIPGGKLSGDPRMAEPRIAELATRLDGLIARLRGVLGEPSARPEHWSSGTLKHGG